VFLNTLGKMHSAKVSLNNMKILPFNNDMTVSNVPPVKKWSCPLMSIHTMYIYIYIYIYIYVYICVCVCVCVCVRACTLCVSRVCVCVCRCV